MESEIENHKCTFLGCEESQKYEYGRYWDYCKFHRNGGIFGSGESYEQYQIIEQDFIDFIKAVPLTADHFNVYSPILRDIIIRTCVQVEIFFKEWAKENCSENTNSPFWEKYNSPKKEKSWSIKDYFYFNSQFDKTASIHVMPLNQDIFPFNTWTSKEPPVWWKVYNDIKHGGYLKNNQSNLENALNALGGLFLIHCTNHYSRSYLKKFNLSTVTNTGFNTIEFSQPDLTTPIDSKKYLFKLNTRYHSSRIKLVTEDELNKRLKPNSRF